jgi:hypothetical protein
VAGEFECRPDVLQGIAQSLLEMKKMARSIEQSADALLALAYPSTAADLAAVIQKSRDSSDILGGLYRSIAREAMS